MITVNKNAAYPVATDKLKKEKTLEAETKLRQSKYLNNLVEQRHCNVKQIMKPLMGFQSFNTVRRTLHGIEAMNMTRRGHIKEISRGNSVSQSEFINQIFGVTA